MILNQTLLKYRGVIIQALDELYSSAGKFSQQFNGSKYVMSFVDAWNATLLEVSEIWNRINMDICHVKNQNYLTIIDCGPSRYAIWRRIRHQDTASVIEQLEDVFFERGAPTESLTTQPAFVVKDSANLQVAGVYRSYIDVPTFLQAMEYRNDPIEP